METSKAQLMYEKLRGYAIIAILLVLCGIAWWKNPNFATLQNLSNILVQAAPIAITAYGMTFVMIGGGFDLSVGSIAALAAMVAASIGVRTTEMAPLASAALVAGGAVGAGTVLGLLNGVLVARIKVNPFVATLGTMLIVRSMAELYGGGGNPIGLPPKSLIGELAWGSIAGIPVPIWLLFLGLGVSALVLGKTKLGRGCYALGGNEQAAWLSGIKTPGLKQLTYVIAGGAAGLSGLVVLGKVMTAQATAATGHELDVIAAVIIGGTPLGGGAGKPSGTLVGAIALVVINNLLAYLGVDPSLQKMVKGAIIIVAVAVDSVYSAGQNKSEV